MDSITPLLAAFWGWVGLFVFWYVAAFFARKTKSTESFWGRMQHVFPMYAAFYLIFTRHRYFLIWGELYDTGWKNWIVYLGLLLTAGGIGFAIWARVHLGRYWSGLITLKEGHKVIRTGPYRWVRHPIYTGWLVGMLGSAILAGTLDGFLGFELITLAFLIKLQREERMLVVELGEEYRQFMREVSWALVPFVSSIGPDVKPTIQSEAFNKASLSSERHRAIGLLCVCAGFIVMDVVNGIADPTNIRGYMTAMFYWVGLAIYEGILLAVTVHAQWTVRAVRAWVWGVSTAIECLLPSVALLGLTADKLHIGPYKALVSSTVMIYPLFIILSTLRLSPAMCVISGVSSSAGYVAVLFFTLQMAPQSKNRHIMPDLTYVTNAILLCGAGVLAGAVARQIRQHVVAALAEAETRRKLDRVEHDLQTARTIQMGLLPKGPPKIEGYDVAGFCRPADQTGGDFYDWFELPDGRGMFIIADAAGHGIGPAILVTACRAYFRALANDNDPLDRMTGRVDALIATDVRDGRFITAAIALLDPKSNRLSLYSAGHGPLFLYSAANDCVETIESDQPPLGIGSFQEETPARVIELGAGDVLVLVTDGFFECCNAAGEMLGAGRLGEAIRRCGGLESAEIIERLNEEVSEFSRGVLQGDDMTAVVMKRRGAK